LRLTTSVSAPQAKKKLLRLRVTAAAEAALRGGHPWLFADSIREQNRAGRTGELAAIYDRRDRFLAIGLFDADSPLRVRVLHAGKPVVIDAGWWRQRLGRALSHRAGFDEHTTGYRCIHGESDGWPGLVLDRYASTFVMKLYTAAWFPRIEEVAGLFHAVLKPERLVLRLSRNIQTVAERDFGWKDGQSLEKAIQRAAGVLTADKSFEFAIANREESGQIEVPHESERRAPAREAEASRTAARRSGPVLSESGRVVFFENGLRFEADVVRGQKTGFFLDQRENRRRVETLATGRAALNAFSFSGGFSLYAARGGAQSVTDLDISAYALEAGQRNFLLNQTLPNVARCSRETIQADAFEWLANNSRRSFDLVILDPPSLAKREVERPAALAAYSRLAAQGIRALRDGGILVAASCSSHVPSRDFFEAVRSAATRSRRRFHELERTGHPLDHPATFPEAEYLKCIYLLLADA
jgi:23S rRNA (cytosine1962-C5)-methyltransferase